VDPTLCSPPMDQSIGREGRRVGRGAHIKPWLRAMS
jgi:hypothetical protein